MERFCVLSGPSFAVEVAREAPTAVVVASGSAEAAVEAQSLFQTGYFRVYTNTDVVGVELAGALKNVIALAAGATAGLGYGHNTLAALITRGLAEITRLGVAMGAQKSYLLGAGRHGRPGAHLHGKPEPEPHRGVPAGARGDPGGDPR